MEKEVGPTSYGQSKNTEYCVFFVCVGTQARVRALAPCKSANNKPTMQMTAAATPCPATGGGIGAVVCMLLRRLTHFGAEGPDETDERGRGWQKHITVRHVGPPLAFCVPH